MKKAIPATLALLFILLLFTTIGTYSRTTLDPAHIASIERISHRIYPHAPLRQFTTQADLQNLTRILNAAYIRPANLNHWPGSRTSWQPYLFRITYHHGHSIYLSMGEYLIYNAQTFHIGNGQRVNQQLEHFLFGPPLEDATMMESFTAVLKSQQPFLTWNTLATLEEITQQGQNPPTYIAFFDIDQNGTPDVILTLQNGQVVILQYKGIIFARSYAPGHFQEIVTAPIKQFPFTYDNIANLADLYTHYM